MSKIDAPETDTTEHSGSKSCECGGNGKHSKDKAGKPTTADAERKPEGAAHGHARDPEHSSGCCGGHKAHR